MNGYTVDWSPQALRSLATAWLNARDRQAVTQAEARIDALLAADPLGNGRHLSEGLYILSVPPLVVFSSVDPARRAVEITDVTALP